MGRKVRKQLNIDDLHEATLKAEAERLSISESEVLRQVLDAWIAEDADARRAAAIARHEEILRHVDERRSKIGPGADYTFRRDDAYEDRMKRYDHE